MPSTGTWTRSVPMGTSCCSRRPHARCCTWTGTTPDGNRLGDEAMENRKVEKSGFVQPREDSRETSLWGPIRKKGNRLKQGVL